MVVVHSLLPCAVEAGTTHCSALDYQHNSLLFSLLLVESSLKYLVYIYKKHVTRIILLEPCNGTELFNAVAYTYTMDSLIPHMKVSDVHLEDADPRAPICKASFVKISIRQKVSCACGRKTTGGGGGYTRFARGSPPTTVGGGGAYCETVRAGRHIMLRYTRHVGQCHAEVNGERVSGRRGFSSLRYHSYPYYVCICSTAEVSCQTCSRFNLLATYCCLWSGV